LDLLLAVTTGPLFLLLSLLLPTLLPFKTFTLLLLSLLLPTLLAFLAGALLPFLA
jgi:hypothetical protein